MPLPGASNHRFPRSHRLGRNRDFQAVFDLRHRRESGPLLVYGCPNDLEHARLGLSVSRKVGGAVRRVSIKRRLREAFRSLLPEHRSEFDFIIVVRPHRLMKFAEYQRHLETAMRKVVQEWRTRPEDETASSAG